MKKYALVFLIAILAACDLGEDSFEIRFANKGGNAGTQFAIGLAADDITAESGSLAVDAITGYSYASAGTYFLYIDTGSGWVLNPSYALGEPGLVESCTFEAGKKYEYGTDGGAYMYVIEN